MSIKRIISSILSTTIFSVLVLTGCAAGPKLTPTDLSYSETVKVPGMQRDELFTKISLWSTEAFKGPDVSIIPPITVPERSKVLSANHGQVVANHTVAIHQRDWPTDFFIFPYSNVTIAVSDEQYKISFEISGIQHGFLISGQAPWKYSKKYEASMIGKGFYKKINALNFTKNSWQQLADALRATVSGTVIDK